MSEAEKIPRRSAIWVIIPVYNEASSVREVISKVSSYGYTVVAVDDCSTDQSLAELNAISNIHVLHHMLNLGQGAALQTGITYALKKGAEYLVTFDADGQHPAQAIESFIKPLLNREADVTLGSRFAEGGAATNIPIIRKLILKTAAFITRLTTGLKLTDTHNGFRAFTAAAAQKICLTQNRMAHASQILSQISYNRLKVKELPVVILYTPYSLAKGQQMKDSVTILWDNITQYFLR
jgi:glycosyltransferase involved in cell wall biosynthesis